MLQCRERRFFLGGYADLGKLSSEKYSEQRCVIESYVPAKDRWVVKLWEPHFKAEKILVREQNILFTGFGVPCHKIPRLPSHLRVSRTPNCGNGLFCDADWAAGQVVMEEDPLMVVANRGDGSDHSNFVGQWNLYSALESDRGPESPVLKAFLEMSDGGKSFVDQHLNNAIAMQMSSGKNIKEEQQLRRSLPECGTEAQFIAGVVARWQTNSHDFATCDQDQSCLFLWASKMQHSCEPNCSLMVDSDTGCCIVRTLLQVSRGEQLTNDYFNGDEEFHALDVGERRARLSCRGFICNCDRCMRESDAS